MRQRTFVVATRCLIVNTVTLCLFGLLWSVVRAPLDVIVEEVGRGGNAGVADLPFDTALTALCAAAVVLCGAWIAAMCTLIVAQTIAHTWAEAAARTGQLERKSSAPGRALARLADQLAAHLCPSFARSLVLACCGVAITTGLATAPAFADAAGLADPATAVATTSRATSLDGLAVPDRMAGATARHAAPHNVTVLPGDSLWSIAERSLPADASDHEISVAWHQLHRANRDRIGTDPDLIFPGATLHLPHLNRKEQS